ncbi:hypothetical protein [Pseudomonas phage K4]|nr:hypothetical protein [Pseudomonas phage K4]
MPIIKHKTTGRKLQWSELLDGKLYIEAEQLGCDTAHVYKFLMLEDGDFLLSIFDAMSYLVDQAEFEGYFYQVEILEVELKTI